MKSNEEILQERTEQYNKKPGARVGDFLKLPYGLITRFTHEWEDSIQTGGTKNGSYYLGGGYLSYSGGLDSGAKKIDLVATEETREGSIWFFKNNDSRAHNGIEFMIQQRVFELREGADLSGFPQIREYEREQYRNKAETITRINGNGQPYTMPLPEIWILKPDMSDFFIKQLEEQTGLKFDKRGCCQPLKHSELTTLLSMEKWETNFYNNATHNNTLFLKQI